MGCGGSILTRILMGFHLYEISVRSKVKMEEGANNKRKKRQHTQYAEPTLCVPQVNNNIIAR
jgi:hypothetical protein